MGFSRQEYWSGLPCLPPGELPHPGIEPRSLCILDLNPGLGQEGGCGMSELSSVEVPCGRIHPLAQDRRRKASEGWAGRGGARVRPDCCFCRLSHLSSARCAPPTAARENWRLEVSFAPAPTEAREASASYMRVFVGSTLVAFQIVKNDPTAIF